MKKTKKVSRKDELNKIINDVSEHIDLTYDSLSINEKKTVVLKLYYKYLEIIKSTKTKN